MNRNCTECGALIAGRTDKKFCSDQCRNTFHNRENGETNHLSRRVNHILRNNRRILRELSEDGNRPTVQKSNLASAGFDFEYHTRICRAVAGSTWYFCYEYAWLHRDQGELPVIRFGNEMFTDDPVRFRDRLIGGA